MNSAEEFWGTASATSGVRPALRTVPSNHGPRVVVIEDTRPHTSSSRPARSHADRSDRRTASIVMVLTLACVALAMLDLYLLASG